MKKTFTKQYLRDNCGCYKETPGKLEACSFMQKEEPITIMDILESEISFYDKHWFVIYNCNLSNYKLNELSRALLYKAPLTCEHMNEALIEFTNNN